MAHSTGRSDASTPSSGATNVIDLLSSSLRERSRVRHLSVGEIVVREGEQGTDAFILLSGRCDVLVNDEVLSAISPGELFGEIACLGTGVRAATVRASADCDVLELSGDAVKDELQRCPALLDRFLVAMASRVRDMSRREATIRAEQRKLRRMLESMQPSLERFANHPALSVDVHWQPFSFGSGDYYDVIDLSNNRVLFALGDVMGHGVPTTPIVGMMRGQLHDEAGPTSRPHELLADLHRHLQQHGPSNVFMTLTLLVVDLNSMSAEYAIAGPPCPLLWRDNRCTALSSQIGWTLGYPFGGDSFVSESLALAKGDVLFFFTDGVSDAAHGPDPDEDALGVDGVTRIVEEMCATDRAGLAQRLFSGVDRFRAGWPLGDDATALVVGIR